MQVFAKKTQKNLVNSKKSSTFAAVFVRGAYFLPFPAKAGFPD